MADNSAEFAGRRCDARATGDGRRRYDRVSVEPGFDMIAHDMIARDMIARYMVTVPAGEVSLSDRRT